MDDRTLQRKLDQMVRLGNELHREARRRYGDEALLFHEADGALYIMDRWRTSHFEDLEPPSEHVKHSANGFVEWGQGAF